MNPVPDLQKASDFPLPCRKVAVLGGGGFIGNHLVNALKREGFYVRAVDIKFPAFGESAADEFLLTDLRVFENVQNALDEEFCEIYQLAADMGGAGYILTKDHDSTIMRNSSLINLHVAEVCKTVSHHPRLFFSSSACVYPARTQMDPKAPNCVESSAYPAEPDSEYGWEKLFAERLYLAYRRNFNLDVRIARLHNIFGPLSTWYGGKEKAPAAICRKVALAKNNSEIDVWGDGQQTRSFLYIDECLEGIRRLMDAEFCGPVNLGSEEMISINDFTRMVVDISGKDLHIKNGPGPVGVMGRRSHNKLIHDQLGWAPSQPLQNGIEILYEWILEQVEQLRGQNHADDSSDRDWQIGPVLRPEFGEIRVSRPRN
jgi:GDP-D-mannose 3', 5'-epimerase